METSTPSHRAESRWDNRRLSRFDPFDFAHDKYAANDVLQRSPQTERSRGLCMSARVTLDFARVTLLANVIPIFLRGERRTQSTLRDRDFYVIFCTVR